MPTIHGKVSSICLSVGRSVYLSVCPSVCLSVCPSVCLCLCLSVSLSAISFCLSIHLSAICLCICLCSLRSISLRLLSLYVCCFCPTCLSIFGVVLCISLLAVGLPFYIEV